MIFPLAFILLAVNSAFSARTYIKVSSKFSTMDVIEMILEKA